MANVVVMRFLLAPNSRSWILQPPHSLADNQATMPRESSLGSSTPSSSTATQRVSPNSALTYPLQYSNDRTTVTNRFSEYSS